MIYGEYDDKLWDNDAKKEIYAKWDPNQPRSPLNFNPFETWDGNSPDASGFYPGEIRYKDPQRGDVNFQQMMDERAEAEERAGTYNTACCMNESWLTSGFCFLTCTIAIVFLYF